MDNQEIKKIISAQKSEITSYFVYLELSKISEKNRELFLEMANDEMTHYLFWKGITGKDLSPDKLQVFYYSFVARFFGLTFGCKLLENNESDAQLDYNELKKSIPSIGKMIEDEERHEKQLIGMVQEEKLKYVGSIVLGLNDALVELTGTLAGLSFAFQNTQIISITGLITGIAASMSMAASEYLSQRAEGGKTPFKSSAYTGISYILTVLLLVSPFFIFESYISALALSLFVAIAIIFAFNYYLSVAKDFDFKKRFLEMALISLGVAAISFAVGIFIRIYFGVEI